MASEGGRHLNPCRWIGPETTNRCHSTGFQQGVPPGGPSAPCHQTPPPHDQEQDACLDSELLG